MSLRMCKSSVMSSVVEVMMGLVVVLWLRRHVVGFLGVSVLDILIIVLSGSSESWVYVENF